MVYCVIVGMTTAHINPYIYIYIYIYSVLFRLKPIQRLKPSLFFVLLMFLRRMKYAHSVTITQDWRNAIWRTLRWVDYGSLLCAVTDVPSTPGYPVPSVPRTLHQLIRSTTQTHVLGCFVCVCLEANKKRAGGWDGKNKRFNDWFQLYFFPRHSFCSHECRGFQGNQMICSVAININIRNETRSRKQHLLSA